MASSRSNTKAGMAARCLLAVAASALPVLATGGVTIPYLEGLRPVAADQVATLGADLFGDKVNLFNGSLSFEQTDTSLPGNNALPVAIIRKHDAGREELLRGAFGDWDVAVPSIGGVFERVDGWVNSQGHNRCSGFNVPPTYFKPIRGYEQPPSFPYSAATKPAPPTPAPPLGGAGAKPMTDSLIAYSATDYWHGSFLSVPGHGSQEVLRRAPNYIGSEAQPAGTRTWPLVTHQNWQIGCLASVQNGAGEGFVAKAPDGTEYRFDWMIRRDRDGVKKSGTVLERQEVQIVATEVKDRFGNWVRYTYNPASPAQLQRIESSDGRLITLSYTSGRVSRVDDGTRKFDYTYDSAGRLQHLIQPDGSRWTFDLAGLRYPYTDEVGESATCEFPGYTPADDMKGSMTHPSGARGEFTTRYQWHGRTDVLRACHYVPHSTTITTGAAIPRRSIGQSLVKKQITGPGMPSPSGLVWTYNYPSVPTSWKSCTTCTQHTKNVTVTGPDGHSTVYTYGVRWEKNEGQLLAQYEGVTAAGALRQTHFTYRDYDSILTVPAIPLPYPERFGISIIWNGDYLASRHRPMESRVVTQQGESFTWRVDHTNAAAADGFDKQARPIKTRRFCGASPDDGIRERVVFKDNFALWVLGQPASTIDVPTGITINASTYNELTALPDSESEFGRVVRRFEYHEDGTLKSYTNEGGHKTGFGSWKRGNPQTITYADGAIEKQQLNNLGKPDWIDNAVGSRHSYEYDSMGRVARVNYPAEAAFTYHPTEIRYSRANSAANGLPIGHWRQEATTGQGKVTRVFDAFWRERIRISEDTDSPETTRSIVETRYDHDGRKTFVSYPMRPAGGVYAVGDSQQGQFTTYDALGRPTLQRATSELGNLDTSTEYLPGFKRKVTNPRGYSTTTTFQAFDQPSEETISTIEAPEAVTLTIDRDRYGKARRITRSGSFAGSSQSLARRYVYDSHQRLCKTIEPETAATVVAYDAAGNVKWRASGQALTDETNCQQGSVPEDSKISYSYDVRGRVKQTRLPQYNETISQTYTLDGLLLTMSSSNSWPDSAGATPWVTSSQWTYTYTRRRMLTHEQLNWGDATTWAFEWTINSHGHVSALKDPWGNMAYEPTALGAPTRVGNYATQVRYHPNGTAASYRYQNGIVFTSEPNARGLPETWKHGSVQDDLYTYDPNGNVESIDNRLPGGVDRSMPLYDGLDRLQEATGAWGQAAFTYDALDNLVASTVGARVLTHTVSAATNQLTNITGSLNLMLAYDSNGNVSQHGTQSFQFDKANRLRLAVGKGRYAYDGHGRRMRMWQYAGSRSSVFGYTRDGKLRFSWQSGGPGTTRYVHLGDRLIAEHAASGVITYQHTDALGSPVARTNASGAQVGSPYSYEPYGKAVAGTPEPTSIGYTGHVNDPDIGMVYMQQRYYDPVAGRFLSVDPVVTDAKTGDSFNRYVYGNNNPFKFKDPDGRHPIGASDNPVRQLWDAAFGPSKAGSTEMGTVSKTTVSVGLVEVQRTSSATGGSTYAGVRSTPALAIQTTVEGQSKVGDASGITLKVSASAGAGSVGVTGTASLTVGNGISAQASGGAIGLANDKGSFSQKGTVLGVRPPAAGAGITVTDKDIKSVISR